MPAAAFEGALGTGHGCFPPRANTEGDPTFLINGVPAHVEGNAWSAHTCGNNTHSSTLSAGSATFLINGQGAGRIGDPVACGSVVAEGDETFLVSD